MCKNVVGQVATNEQLGTLIGEEEGLRAKYESEERQFRRNEGRQVYENPVADYVLGEVVFDGKRWHLAVAAVLGLVGLAGVYFLAVLSYTGKLAAGKAAARKKKAL